MSHTLLRLVCALSVGLLAHCGPALIAHAESTSESYLQGIDEQANRRALMHVYSASMQRTIDIEIQRSSVARPSPVLYLLNGANGGINGESWQHKTDVFDFLANKSINIVSPLGGRSSYYTDWRHPDPEIGINKWRTFLTIELPPIVDAALRTNGRNSIAGLSASATSALALAESSPGLYDSVSSFSGCAGTSDPRGQLFVRLTVEVFGFANTANMWGPPNDPEWIANDALVNAERLRGTKVFVASGSGVPGRYDALDGPYAQPGVGGLAAQLSLGSIIEAAVRDCTVGLQRRLNELNIPATFRLSPDGTHSWGYWRDDLRAAWAFIAESLDLPE